MKLSVAFKQLEEAMKGMGLEMNRTLSPGLTLEEIKTFLEGRPYQLPDDVKRLYQWRNGEKYDNMREWLTGTANHFVPLQDAFISEEGYELRREMWGLDYPERLPVELDAPGYIILFEDGGGDEILVPCWNRQMETSPIFYNPEVGEVAICYGSVTDMINTFAACYEESVFSFQEGEFTTNFPLLYEVSRRLNPQAPHWQQ